MKQNNCPNILERAALAHLFRNMFCYVLDIFRVLNLNYRVELESLVGICTIDVPECWQTSIIIIVDNPERLCDRMGCGDPMEAARALETYLSKQSANNVFVRCNLTNMGASASRNRGIEESAAEFILFLDDDVTLEPGSRPLYAYEEAIQAHPGAVGFAGMVLFPRRFPLSVAHGAVIMSYLTVR